jgi:hypothetical protein
MSECRIRYGRYPDERDYCLTHSQGEDDCLRARIAELEVEVKRLREERDHYRELALLRLEEIAALRGRKEPTAPSLAGEKCVECGGEGDVIDEAASMSVPVDDGPVWMDCPSCGGTGKGKP